VHISDITRSAARYTLQNVLHYKPEECVIQHRGKQLQTTSEVQAGRQA